MFARLIEWFTLKDYLREKDEATKAIVARFSRGNTSMQNGSFLDEEAVKKLVKQGDNAMSSLKRLIPAN